MLEIVVLITIILTLHYLSFLSLIYKGLKQLSRYKPITEKTKDVTVLVPFRNESENILDCLESLQNQDYPKDKTEIIFIDDNSIDDSVDKLRNNIDDKGIKIVSAKSGNSERAHKKRAIEEGLRYAKGEIIITTDADCTHKETWLQTLVNTFEEETGFVAGPVDFRLSEKFFDKLQRLEFAGLVLSGAGLVASNQPAICSAANIAYRKELFEKVGGYRDNHSLSSGDDELLMQKIHRETDYKVDFCYKKEALVTTKPNKTVGDFYQQRKRWASKGIFYSNKFLVFRLVLIYLFYLSMPVQILLGLLWSSALFVIFFFTFLIKITYEYLIVHKGAKDLYDSGILTVFLPAEILHVPYILLSGFMGLFGKYKWKSRKIDR
jgi:cellulose synthase/poly-beta-1,6-N-acetylglucosamine synthase-like glycosyltransferase